MCFHSNLKQLFTTCSAQFIFLSLWHFYIHHSTMSPFWRYAWADPDFDLGSCNGLKFCRYWTPNFLTTRCRWILVPSCLCMFYSKVSSSYYISQWTSVTHLRGRLLSQQKLNITDWRQIHVCAKLNLWKAINAQVTKDVLSLTYCRRQTETPSLFLSLAVSLSSSHRHISTDPQKSHRQGGLALAQSVTRRLLIANSRERSRSIPCKVDGGRPGKRRVSIWLLLFYLLSEVPPKLHNHLHLSIFLPEGRAGEA